MKVSLLLVLLWAAPVSAQVLTPRSGDVAVLGGTLWDGTGDQARPNPGLLIRNGTIVRVGIARNEAGEAERIEVADDEFIMPGLFDLHAHYAVDLFGEGRIDEYTVNPVLFLANGVTSTFPAGEMDPDEAARGRQRVASGEIPGPRIYSSGPYWGTARPGWNHEAMTPDSIRKEATFWALKGVRGFKAKGIQPQQLEALIDVAHRHGITVTGHLDSGVRNSVNPRDAILMGIDRIEHFMGGDAFLDTRSAYASIEAFDLEDPETLRQIERQTRLFVERGAYFDATLSAYDYWAAKDPEVYDYWVDELSFLTPWARDVAGVPLPRDPLGQFERIYYKKRQTVKLFYDFGGADQITLGTDHPSWGEWWSGFGVHRELQSMVLSGIPNAAALRAGTINAARAFGVDERLGTLEQGKYADLVVIAGNPLNEITDSRNVRGVMVGGDWHLSELLLQSVIGRMGPVNEAEADWWKGNTRLGR